MSFFSNEITPQSNFCQCYKKLDYLEVPIFKTEEDEDYGEERDDIALESSFQLPGVLVINMHIAEYPTVDEQNLPNAFRLMAQVIPNLFDFELNILSFWILDMFVEGLWTSQKAGMNHDHQRATLLWIAYAFNYIQRENPSRKELFLHLKTVILVPDFGENELSGEQTADERSSESTIPQDAPEENCPAAVVFWKLPLPPGTTDITADNESLSIATEELTGTDDPVFSNQSGEEDKIGNTTSETDEEETSTEKNIRHMKIILEILYRIFARLWVFMEIQAAFHVMPSLEQVALPFNLNVPKRVNKIDSFISNKSEKFGRRTSKSKSLEVLSEEMEMEKQLHKNDFILPLQSAEESKAYIRQVFANLPSDISVFSKGRDRKKQG